MWSCDWKRPTHELRFSSTASDDREDELEQLSGSGHSNMLSLRRTLSWTSVPPSCLSLDAWLAASWVTWEVDWHWFDLLAGRRPWLGCSALAAVHWKLQPVHRRACRYSSPTWNRRYCTLLSEPSGRSAEFACDAVILALWRNHYQYMS